MRNWLWVVLVGAVAMITGAAIRLSAVSDRQPWPIYLIECRYAEIDAVPLRQVIGGISSGFGIGNFCANIYAGRGDEEEKLVRWKQAAREYRFGIRIAPDDLTLRLDDGLASLASNDPKQADEDFSTIIHADPTDTEALNDRGQSREMLGNWGGALADYSAAIAKDAKVYGSYTYRGRALTLLGRYSEGIADLTRAVKLLPHDQSSSLWLHLARERVGQPDADLPLRTKDMSLNRWPGPVLKYFLGRLSSDMLMRVAASDPDTQYWHQQCDAWFYLGEDALAKKDRTIARSLFQRTVSHCDAVDYEWDAAKLELSQLK
ncbi:MAG TPA: tetratricopeptide repeat protein [Rhizomicrobium sp.]|jgi:lipoprotein NlpI